ncbi:PepSY-like domain-containing protein [Bacteroides sp. 224]|uniref:PepSY-like domain-containing protein n=1 Tax=Bacteroides sp. 224 TaxID=2302936 RepID=UPI0013D79ED6|nr:PepSY-like domain-containing protein [Bacteroides sp. 224]NDV65138.1 ribosome biogenesis protein [Bacteroides sp. 224]
MKEINLTLLTLLCAVLFGFTCTSCSDDDDDYKPEQKFEEALSAKYPNATRVEWEKKRTFLVADCWVGDKDIDVWFTESAEWRMTETDLLPANLPEAITTAIAASKYASWRIDDVDYLEYPSKDAEYVIEVEQGKTGMALYYTATGEFLREKDVSADDTNWPG